MTLVVAALALGTVAVAGSAAFAVTRALELWRTLRAFPAAIDRELEKLDASVATLAAREPAERDSLSESVARLQRSRAQLSLLLGALARVREQASGLLAIYPRK